MKEIKNEYVLMNKKDFEALLKKQEFCLLGEDVGKIGEILGLATAVVGVFAKSPVVGGIGLAFFAGSEALKLVSKKARANNEKKIQTIQGKRVLFVEGKNNNSQKNTDESIEEEEKL